MLNFDDLFCDYNTLTTVNSVTNTRTIQETPMFHGCTITNLNITINKWKCVKVSAFKTFEVTGPHQVVYSRLVIGTSRTVGSAKKFVRITSDFGGGEFTKTLRKVCTCQKLKFAFLPLEYGKIRECYAVANAFTIRNMYSLLLYMNCNSRKINRPTKNMTKIVTLLHF